MAFVLAVRSAWNVLPFGVIYCWPLFIIQVSVCLFSESPFLTIQPKVAPSYFQSCFYVIFSSLNILPPPTRGAPCKLHVNKDLAYAVQHCIPNV